MSKILPKIGDYIEVEDDGVGSVDNAPWTKQVKDILPEGYLMTDSVDEDGRIYKIPDEAFYKETINEDGRRFVYANSKYRGSVEEIPTSTVPVNEYKDSSVEAYKLGIIKPDNSPVAEEEDVDILRSVSLEDAGSVVYFIDVLNHKNMRAFNRAVDIMGASMNDGIISNESFKEVKDIVSDIGEKFKYIISSRQDLCYNALKRIKELELELQDYKPYSTTYETRFADDVHVNNSLDPKQIKAAAERQLKLAKFISERFKDTLRGNLSTIIVEINKQAKRNYLEKKINLGSLRKIISDVSKDIKETLSLSLVDLIVGVSDKRHLIGGYTLERVSDWKNNLINIASVLTFTPGYTLDMGRLITLDKSSYKGNKQVKPLTKSEAQELLNIAKEIINESLVKEDKITFSTKEFSDLIDNAYISVEDEPLVKKLMHNKDTAVEKQIAGVSMFPIRLIYRNIKAVNAIINFVDEGIKRGSNEKLSLKSKR